MMIKRYTAINLYGEPDIEEYHEGDLVTYEDHLAEVKRGQEVVATWIEINDKNKNEIALVNAKAFDLESELASMREKLEEFQKDAERFRLACAYEDNADLLLCAVFNHCPDIESIRKEFDVEAIRSLIDQPVRGK